MTPIVRLSRDEVRRAAETAAIGGAGAILFTLLHIPAGAILGALLFTAGASLAGRRLGWPMALRNLLYFATGLGAGASVTPEAVRAALVWPLSIFALVVTTVGMWALGAAVFRRISGVDRRTAVFATAPGALPAVMVLAEEQEADVVSVAVAQTLRISTLVAMAPLALSFGHVAPAAAHETPMIVGPAAWAVLLVGALAGFAVARALKWPVALFLGALLGSAVMHGLGVVTVSMPASVFQITAAGLGALIGSRFAGIRVSDLVRLLPASLGSLAAMALIAAPAGALIGWLIGVGPAAGLMAFAPGSMEMMVAVSLSLNAQPAYVAAHHVVRTLLLLAALPALAARWSARKAV